MPARGRPFPKKHLTEEARQEARRAAGRRYYEKNRDLVIRKSAERMRDPVVARQAALRRKFKMSLDDYDKLLQEQGGACAICRGGPIANRFLSVDHDHKTGKIRGLLCVKCNSGLGQLRDDPELLKRAWEYLNG